MCVGCALLLFQLGLRLPACSLGLSLYYTRTHVSTVYTGNSSRKKVHVFWPWLRVRVDVCEEMMVDSSLLSSFTDVMVPEVLAATRVPGLLPPRPRSVEYGRPRIPLHTEHTQAHSELTPHWPPTLQSNYSKQWRTAKEATHYIMTTKALMKTKSSCWHPDTFTSSNIIQQETQEPGCLAAMFDFDPSKIS